MLPGLSALLFVCLLIASYRDIRTREVPDTLSYGLIVVALLTSLGVAILTKEIMVIWTSLAGLLAGMAIGILMYRTKQWGGGDAKLLMGVGAVLGVWVDGYALFWFLALLILCGAVYGLLAMLFLAIRYRKQFSGAFIAKLRDPRVHRIRLGLVGMGVLILIALFLVDWDLRLLLLGMLVGVYLLFYAWILTAVIEREVLTKRLETGKLTEGDWLSEDVEVRGKVLIPKENPGLTLEQIAKLRKARVKSVVVREGIPFVPAFLLAYLAYLLLERMGWLFL